MEYKLYKKTEQESSRWTGGRTTQLAIFPEGAGYVEREFTWRLSTATCELEEASFSKLPDFQRTLMVLEGEVVLAHQDVRVAKLKQYEQDTFDGGWRTKSFGKITDYNLMVRKGNEGTMEILEPAAESRELELQWQEGHSLMTEALFCADGYATVSVQGQTLMMTPGDQLVVNFSEEDKEKLPHTHISVMGEGRLVRCRIWYDYSRGEFDAIKIEEKPASASDFRECVFIANTQYRFSKFTNKRLKKIWYDEALQNAIDKVNNFYITDIVMVLGAAAVVAIGANRITGITWLFVLLAWAMIHMMFIAPLLYFIVVPKPVSAHIKNIEDLTPYEQKIREKRMNSNPRIEKILGRYKMTGTDRYDEQGNRIDNFGRDKKV